jgi:hypothetical protein
MKKYSKKLTLNRETLRFLEDRRLEDVQGGYHTDFTCHNSCNSTPRSGCEICPSYTGC